MVSDEMRAVLEDLASRFSSHIIDIAVRGSRGRAVVEIVIDAEQGVTTGLCADVSRDAALLIDRAGWVRGPYRLEVTSPGIDRPLRFPWQYRKHIGRMLEASVQGPAGPERRTGRLSAVNDRGIVLEAAEGGSPREIAFEHLTGAVVRAPW